MQKTILVGTRKGLFKLVRGPSRWDVERVSFLGTGVPSVLADARDGSIYAAVGHGHFGSKMHRSKDGGATWQEIAAPTYPERPKDADDIDPMRKTPIPWNTELLWTIEAADPSKPGSLWCGTVPGGLFRSDDAGASWTLLRSLWDHPGRRKWFGGGYDWPGIHSISVDPRDPRRVLLAVSCGGVWLSEDAGASWNVGGPGMYAAYMPAETKDDPGIQDVHRLARCASAPDVIWAQHHNGVFRSTDGAKSWTEVTAIQPSNFGFAVAAHPRDPGTAWFVPAIKDEVRVPVGGQLVVARTRDGGKSFDALREGLPQQQAYDLIYRHGLDVDATGEALVMGSTTGSLWVSESQGEAWNAVSHHLPPVYCVRFG